jgi:bacterioferritin-associated ferredoxin
MYVCLCNALRDCEIDAAISQGWVTSDEVYNALGVEPQCGSCACEIELRICAQKVGEAA